jgi:hypothetical protein
MTKFKGFKRVAVVAVSAASLAGVGAGVADAAVPQGAKWSAPAVSQSVKVAVPQGAKWRTVAASSRRKCYKRVIHRHGAIEMRRVKCPKAAASKATWGRVGRVGASVMAPMPYRH